MTTVVRLSSCHLLGAVAAHKCVELFDAAAGDLVVGALMEREAERRVHPAARLMHGEDVIIPTSLSFSFVFSPGGCGGLAAQKFVQLFDAAAWDLVVRAEGGLREPRWHCDSARRTSGDSRLACRSRTN